MALFTLSDPKHQSEKSRTQTQSRAVNGPLALKTFHNSNGADPFHFANYVTIVVTGNNFYKLIKLSHQG